VNVSDTTPAAQSLQQQIQRTMTGEQRVLLAWEMSLFVRQLQEARVRQEQPEWSDAEVGRELLRLAFQPAPLPPGLR